MINQDNKKIAFEIIKEIYKVKNSISVTMTGSYSENFNLSKSGDIDIVVICKKLNKKFFDSCIEKIKILKKKYFKKNDTLIINSTFGPIKFYTKNSVVFHLMIYDIDAHIKHTINSPFTCYDWERSNIYVGKSLKDIAPVYKLELRDFTEARRSTNEYLRDILKNKISYREYNFSHKKIRLKKKYFKVNELNKRDFIYHIIKFLIVNYIKYENQNNHIAKEKVIEKRFNEIMRNKKKLQEFVKLREFKKNKSMLSINDPKNLVIEFINKFNKFIKSKDMSTKIYFSRHKKTLLNKNIFLGQKMNPKINDKKNKKEFKEIKIEKCFTSPLRRCVETAELNYNRNKIKISAYLNEINYGDAEGLTLKQFKIRYPKIYNNWQKGIDSKFPKGESSLDVFKRIEYFIKHELKSTKIKKNKGIIVFTHNVVLRSLIGNRFNIARKEWFKIIIPYFNLLEFKLQNNKLYPNIQRKKYQLIFKNFMMSS